MDMSGEYLIGIPRQQAWKSLLDPETLKNCIPGCESFDRVKKDHYRAKIKLVIGPVKASFNTELHITNATPPKSYRLEGTSKAGAVGFGQGHADVILKEDTNGTILRYEATFQVGGRLAQIGSRLIVGATRKIADEFFEKLTKHLDSRSKKTNEPPALKPRLTYIIGAFLLVIIALAYLTL